MKYELQILDIKGCEKSQIEEEKIGKFLGIMRTNYGTGENSQI